MYLIPIAWLYVVLMMAVAEATNPSGTVLGAIITFVLYGIAPVSLVIYLMGTPGRTRARRARDKAELDAANAAVQPPQSRLKEAEAPSGGRERSDRGGHVSDAPDAGGKTPADPVTPVRKEP